MVGICSSAWRCRPAPPPGRPYDNSGAVGRGSGLEQVSLSTQAGQPERDLRPDDQQADQQDRAGHEGNRGHVDIPHGGARCGNTLHDEEQQAEGRRGEADLQRQQDDHAEPDEIEAESLCQREEDRHGQQHHGELVHEHAQHQQDAEHHQQHDRGIQLEAGGEADQSRARAGEGEQRREGRRAEDDQ
ncbi:hypothetical protein AFK68_03575, partial [Hydrocoleum sp. CS-953]